MNDHCAYCGRVRDNLWHRVPSSDPGVHAFVEPAPQAEVKYKRCQHGRTDRFCCGTDEDVEAGR